MPTDRPMTKKPTRRPWWVAPGIGAVLGAGLIAVAAQGSLGAGSVSLPTGPRLSPAVASASNVPSAPPTTTVPDGSTVPGGTAVPPQQVGTVVSPVHPVVTQSADADGAGGTASVAASSTSSASPPVTAGVVVAASVAPNGSGTTSTTTTTTSSTTTTTTTRPKREPGDY